MNTTYVDSHELPWTNANTGLWIDIMPLDGGYDNIDKEKARWKKANSIWHRGLWVRYSLVEFSLCKNILKFLKVLWSKLFFKRKFGFLDKLINICKECDYEKSHYFTDLAIVHYGMREYNPKSYLEHRILIPFENCNFYVCSGYDDWLKHIYGNYMQLPPESEQRKTHDAYISYWK